MAAAVAASSVSQDMEKSARLGKSRFVAAAYTIPVFAPARLRRRISSPKSLSPLIKMTNGGVGGVKAIVEYAAAADDDDEEVATEEER